MKRRILKIITFTGLIIVIALQTVWLTNTYTLIKNNIYIESTKIIEEALNKEIEIRCVHLPKGTTIEGGSDETILWVTYLEEGLNKLGSTLSLNRVDSISSVLLRNQNIKSSLNIYKINLLSNNILQSSKKNNLSSLGTIHSKIIPIKVDGSEGIQLVLTNPFWDIFRRMSLLILATAIMMALVIGCIIYQIRIIAKQNKIAKVREDFSYAMIHDMKQPLCIITSCINLLQNKGMKDRPDIQKHYYNVVENESNRLLSLTEKVLTISKLESHKLDIHKQTVDLAPLFNNLAERFATKSVKPIKFDIDLEVAEIKVDEEYFKEALCNLIDNAIKYSKESIEITIRSVDKEHHTLVKVRDNGIGIAKEDQALIFEKFERASAIGRVRKGGSTGFGLGLTYVQQITEAHGGRVIVNSIEGEFSEFILYIPKIEKNDDQTISC